MRRSWIIGLGCFMLGVFLLTGCGQQTPTINTSNPQPQGLKIKGVVRTTTLSGTIGAPILGAYVSLSGDSANNTVKTNSNGEYAFTNIPDGSYIIVVTAEGHTRSSDNSVTIKPTSSIPADNTITVVDIRLRSNPIIVGFSPSSNSVISNTPTFTITFNETMDTTSVYPVLWTAGVRTYVATSESVPLTYTWDAAGKVLTIVPKNALISNEVYSVGINDNGAKDISGYPWTSNAEQALNPSQDYRVVIGGVPGAPSSLTAVINGKPVTSDATIGADYVDAVAQSNYVGLNWTPSTGVVTGYNIYVSNNATNNFTLIANPLGTTNYANLLIGNIITALYGTANINPLGTANYPLINKPLYIKVVAYNGDGESAAAVTGVKELVGPRVDVAHRVPLSGVVLDNNVYLPPLDNNDFYLAIKEPVDSTSISAANITFVIAPATNVLSATLITNSTVDLHTSAGFGASVYSIILCKTNRDLSSDVSIPQRIMVSGLKDLAGNTMVDQKTTY